jgi:hypothetical protein
MKKYLILIAALGASLSLSGCGLMEVSFKAGFIMALIIATIIGLLIWILHISVQLLKKYFPSVRYYLDGFFRED